MKLPTTTRAVRVALALALLAAAVGAQSGRDSRLFDSPFVGYDTGDYFTARYVYATCLADFDGDGDTDVAVSNWPTSMRPR